jgi:hypothetical protein
MSLLRLHSVNELPLEVTDDVTTNAPSAARRPRSWILGQVAPGAIVSVLLCCAVVWTRHGVAWWALALTMGQAATMVACSRDLKVGWAFGLILQAPWATYDVVTHQYPFIATSVIVSSAQVMALRRLDRTARPISSPDPAVAPLRLVAVDLTNGKRDER